MVGRNCKYPTRARRILWLAFWTITGTWLVRGIVTLYFMGYLPRVEVQVRDDTIHDFNYGFLIAMIPAFCLVNIGTPRPLTWKILAG